MDDRVKSAFGLAADSAKQVMTLSTAIVTLTATLAKNIFEDSTGLEILVADWLVYLVSILAGVWTMLALTGTLEPEEGAETPPSIRGSNVTVPATAQMLTFLVGTTLIVVFGILSLT